MQKCGLVLEGGGFRGMFSTGVVDFFMQKNIKFEYVIGTSFGAVNGGSYVSGQMGRTKDITMRYIKNPKYMGIWNLLKDGSYCGIDFMYNKIPNVFIPFAYEEFYASKMKFKFTVTNCETGQAEYIEKSYIPKKILNDVFRASASFPIISPMVTVGSSLYLDGGIADAIPIKKAIEDGNEKNIVILTQPKGYRKKSSVGILLIKMLYKKYPKLIESFEKRHIVYNETIEYIEKLEQEGKIFVIRPRHDLKVKRFERNKSKLLKIYKEGFRVAERAWEDLEKWGIISEHPPMTGEQLFREETEEEMYEEVVV